MQSGFTLSAILAAGLLAGCGTSKLFGEYDVPESPEVEAAPWPRLADTLTPPPPGEYAPGFPDPAVGVAVNADLAGVAADAAMRAEILAQPVLSEADLRRLRR